MAVSCQLLQPKFQGEGENPRSMTSPVPANVCNELLPHPKPEMPPLSPANRLTWQRKGMPFLCQFLKPHPSNFSWVLFEVSHTSFATFLSMQLIDCSFPPCI